MDQAINPQNIISFSNLLELYIISSIFSALSFVAIIGLFQYITYRKWWKKIKDMIEIIAKEKGAQWFNERAFPEKYNNAKKN